MGSLGAERLVMEIAEAASGEGGGAALASAEMEVLAARGFVRHVDCVFAGHGNLSRWSLVGWS